MVKKTNFMFIDLIFLTILAIFIEYFSLTGGQKFSFIIFRLSLSFVIVYMGMFRWGIKSIFIPFIIGIVTFFTLKEQNLYMLLVYSIGNICIYFNLLWFKINQNKIIKDLYLLFVFVFTGYLLVSIGSAIILSIFESNFLINLIYFLLKDFFTMIIIFLVMIMASRQENLLINMGFFSNVEERKSESYE